MRIVAWTRVAIVNTVASWYAHVIETDPDIDRRDWAARRLLDLADKYYEEDESEEEAA